MPPLPEADFRSLLADRSETAFAEFVADLWEARGREVRRGGDRIVANGRELHPVVDPDGGEFLAKDAIVVSAAPTDTEGSVVDPGDLYHVLLYDVPRERAAALFEAHFDRPLEVESADETAESTADPAPDGTDAGPSEGSGPDASSRGTGTTGSTEGQSTENTPDGPPRGRGPQASDLAARATGAVRRLGGSLRALARDRRVQAVGVVVLVVAATSLWGLFVYQPEPEPSDPPFDADEPPTEGSYRIVSQAHATQDDEQSYVESTRTYVPGDPAVSMGHLIIGTADDRTEYVEYTRPDASYVRMSWTNESAYRRHRQHREDDLKRTVDDTRTIYEVRDGSGEVPREPFGIVLASTLAMLPYERVGNATYQGRDVVRYEPTTGWTIRQPGPHGDPVTYRIRSASGEVLVDPETGALLYADVEATVVEADTWADVLTEPDLELSIHYRVEGDVDRPSAPPWVDGLRSTQGTKIVNATVA